MTTAEEKLDDGTLALRIEDARVKLNAAMKQASAKGLALAAQVDMQDNPGGFAIPVVQVFVYKPLSPAPDEVVTPEGAHIQTIQTTRSLRGRRATC